MHNYRYTYIKRHKGNKLSVSCINYIIKVIVKSKLIKYLFIKAINNQSYILNTQGIKQETSVTYPDMIGTGGYYDALRLAEAGIFTGEQIGSEYIFSPTTSVTRGEFLAMCMELTDTPILSGVSSTGFADDELIPTWQKSYVATALMNGSISAMSETGSATFDANSPITCAQAAVMVSSIFNLSKVTTFAADDSTPTWASQAVANLTACDILPENADTNQTLNRGMTADILSSVMDVLESR